MALNNKNSSSLDNQLLSHSTEKSSEKAGQLRQSQRRQVSKTENVEKNLSFRQQVMESRRMEEEKEQEAEKKSSPSSSINSLGLATSRLLRGAWVNLVSSFGLTLIWINIHVFLSTVFGEKFFCKLGMEWINDSAKRANFEQAKKLGRTVGTFEGPGLACLDLGCLLLVIIAFMIIGGLLKVVSSPLDTISAIFGWAWDQAKELITGS